MSLPTGPKIHLHKNDLPAGVSFGAAVAIDTETTSLDPMRAELVGLSLSITPWEACYVPVAHRYTDAPPQLSREHVLERLRPYIESRDVASFRFTIANATKDMGYYQAMAEETGAPHASADGILQTYAGAVADGHAAAAVPELIEVLARKG